MSTKGFTVVGQAAGRCTELTAGYQARDLLKEVSDALAAFIKVCFVSCDTHFTVSDIVCDTLV